MLVAFQVRLINQPEVNVGSASKKFDENGRLTDDRALTALEKQMATLRAAL
jgi:hypothetical protein